MRREKELEQQPTIYIQRELYQYQPKKRHRCIACGKTFIARNGTVCEGLRTDEETVDKALILMNNGCPPRAIELAFELDEGCALLQIGAKTVILSS